MGAGSDRGYIVADRLLALTNGHRAQFHFVVQLAVHIQLELGVFSSGRTGVLILHKNIATLFQLNGGGRSGRKNLKVGSGNHFLAFGRVGDLYGCNLAHTRLAGSAERYLGRFACPYPAGVCATARENLQRCLLVGKGEGNAGDFGIVGCRYLHLVAIVEIDIAVVLNPWCLVARTLRPSEGDVLIYRDGSAEGTAIGSRPRYGCRSL